MAIMISLGVHRTTPLGKLRFNYHSTPRDYPIIVSYPESGKPVIRNTINQQCLWRFLNIDKLHLAVFLQPLVDITDISLDLLHQRLHLPGADDVLF